MVCLCFSRFTALIKYLPLSRFNYYSFDIPNRAEDEKGLYDAVKWINELISLEETKYKIPPERIIIGGLSQGGALSLLTSITAKKPLAGLFALSTYVPLRKKIPEVILFSFLSPFSPNHSILTSLNTPLFLNKIK